jgi:hypothetical protein
MVRSFLKLWDLYTLKASEMTFTGGKVVQNLAGAVLKFQLKKVLTRGSLHVGNPDGVEGHLRNA